MVWTYNTCGGNGHTTSQLGAIPSLHYYLVFATAGGIQSLPCDEGNGSFLLCHEPLTLSTYLLSIIPDNIKHVTT